MDIKMYIIDYNYKKVFVCGAIQVLILFALMLILNYQFSFQEYVAFIILLALFPFLGVVFVYFIFPKLVVSADGIKYNTFIPWSKIKYAYLIFGFIPIYFTKVFFFESPPLLLMNKNKFIEAIDNCAPISCPVRKFMPPTPPPSD